MNKIHVANNTAKHRITEFLSEKLKCMCFVNAAKSYDVLSLKVQWRLEYEKFWRNSLLLVLLKNFESAACWESLWISGLDPFPQI